MPIIGLKLLDREFQRAEDRRNNRRRSQTLPKPAGCSDLWLAARENRVDLVERLVLEHGAMINGAKAPFGTTPLHRACSGGCEETVVKLIELGADINATTFLSWETPLHYACGNGHTAVCEVLVRAGALIYKKNKEKLTPLQKAAAGGHKLLSLRMIEVDHEVKEAAAKARLQQQIAAARASRDSRDSRDAREDSRPTSRTSRRSRGSRGSRDRAPAGDVDDDDEDDPRLGPEVTCVFKHDPLPEHRALFVNNVKFSLGDRLVVWDNNHHVVSTKYSATFKRLANEKNVDLAILEVELEEGNAMSRKIVKVSERALRSRAWVLHHADGEHEETQRVGSTQGKTRFSDLQALKQHESEVLKSKRALAQVAEAQSDAADEGSRSASPSP